MSKQNNSIETFNIALENYQNNNFKKAESICRKIFKENSTHYQSIFLLGVISAQNKKFQQAIKLLKKAIKINPNFVDAYYNLAIVCDKLEKYQDSINYYKKALEINPNYLEAQLNLGNIFQKSGEYQQAIVCFQKAIEINPNNKNPYAYYNLGHIFNVLGKTQSAINYYKKALEINPNYLEAQLNLGNIFQKSGEYQQAIVCFQKAIEINPHYTEALFNLARIQLAKDDFKNGWIGHEQRTGGVKNVYKSVGIQSENIWDGAKFEGPLVVHGEQGIGDEILYSSIFQDLKKYHSDLIITSDNRLIPLLKRSFPKVKFIDRYEHDYINKNTLIKYKHIFAGSLGKIFRNSIDDFKNNNTWLFACPKKQQEIANNLSHLKKIKIGISWKTSGVKSQDRNISLVKFASFFPKKNFEIINLQYGDINFDKYTLEKNEGRKLVYFEKIDYKNDMERIAALICNCDLIVTVGNAIAHLAGALGKNVWTLVPMGSQWWWHHNRNESLWYPNLKILRQRNKENWDHVFHLLEKKVQSQFFN